MKLIDSKFVPFIKETYQTKYGIVYFFENFIVSEVNEGVIYNLQCSQELTSLVLKLYGNKTNINLISNRVNNYSVNPTYWLDLYKSESVNMLNSISFVTYNKLAYANAKLEQTFIKSKTECFTNLQDAINWLHNISNKMTA